MVSLTRVVPPDPPPTRWSTRSACIRIVHPYWVVAARPSRLELPGQDQGGSSNNVCGDCHRMPFLVSTNTAFTGMDAPTWRGAYDRFLILPQGRLNVAGLLDFDRQTFLNGGFPERAMWRLSWGNDPQFDLMDTRTWTLDVFPSVPPVITTTELGIAGSVNESAVSYVVVAGSPVPVVGGGFSAQVGLSDPPADTATVVADDGLSQTTRTVIVTGN